MGKKKKKKDFSLFSFLTRGIRKLWRHWVLETEKQGKWGNGAKHFSYSKSLQKICLIS